MLESFFAFLVSGRHAGQMFPIRFSIGPVAQLAEQQTLNLRVEGSIPSRLTTSSNEFDDLS